MAINIKEKDFRVNSNSERIYSAALKRKAVEIANELSKSKTVKDIDSIVKRLGNNPKYLKWAEYIAKKMAEGQDFKSKRIWKIYFNEFRGTEYKRLYERLRKSIETISLADIIKENEKYIKSFPEEMGEKAKKKYRELVEEKVVGSKRASEIAKYLKGIGIQRADLIARTESGKATTKITKTRSENAGLKGYIWKTSLDKRVRLSHRMMRNVICFWNNPPVPGIYEAPTKNDRAVHPGEDFNCRCVAVPVVDGSQVKKLSKGGKVYVWKDKNIVKIDYNEVIKMLGVETL